MRKFIILISVVFGWSNVSLATNNETELFLKQVEAHTGEYVVSDGHRDCSGGRLAFNTEDRTGGFHLGSDIVFGALDAPATEKVEDYCVVDTSFKVSKSSITQVLKVSRCPASLKKDESVTTKTLTFNGDKITYSVKENGFKCEFKKVKGESNE